MSNIQYIRPQPVPGSTPYSNTQLSYNRNITSQSPTNRLEMTEKYNQMDPKMKQELSQTINELTQSMSNNTEALVQVQSILNSRASVDQRRLKEWHEGVRQNVRNFNNSNARQVADFKNIGAFNSSDQVKINQISNTVNPNKPALTPEELQSKLTDLNALIGTSKLDLDRSNPSFFPSSMNKNSPQKDFQPSYGRNENIKPSSSKRRGSYRAKVDIETTQPITSGRNPHSQSSTSYLRNNKSNRKAPHIEKVTVIAQDDRPPTNKIKIDRQKTPVRHRVHVDPMINLTPIRRPQQRKNPKREIIREVSRSRLNQTGFSDNKPAQQAPASQGSPQNWIAHQQDQHKLQNNDVPSIERTTTVTNQNQGLSGSQLPIQQISGRSTNVQTGVQTPIEEPVFNENLVNGELVSFKF